MGNYSWLRALRNNPEGCIIDWDAMDTSKLYKDYHMEDEHKKPVETRAKTLKDMAQVWHNTKFISYFNKNYITALCEFSRHLKPYGCIPRLYYEYEGFEELWYIEFVPGTEIINYGICKFHAFMNTAPKHPEDSMETYTTEEETAWCDAMDAFKKDLFERLIDGMGTWSPPQRLVHIELSESEQFRLLFARIHGLI